MKRIFATVIVICMCLWVSIAWSKIIPVPDDQPTIQAGIETASDGDTVLVTPGTYYELIDFKGKAIVVKSMSGYNQTTNGVPILGTFRYAPFPSASHPTLSSNAVEVKLTTIDCRSGNLTRIAL